MYCPHDVIVTSRSEKCPYLGRFGTDFDRASTVRRVSASLEPRSPWRAPRVPPSTPITPSVKECKSVYQTPSSVFVPKMGEIGKSVGGVFDPLPAVFPVAVRRWYTRDDPYLKFPIWGCRPLGGPKCGGSKIFGTPRLFRSRNAVSPIQRHPSVGNVEPRDTFFSLHDILANFWSKGQSNFRKCPLRVLENVIIKLREFCARLWVSGSYFDIS